MSVAPPQVSEVLSSGTIDLELDSRGLEDKDALIEHLAGMLDAAGYIESPEVFLAALHARELETSTYMENAVAIPHARSEAVRRPVVAFGRSTQGIHYESELGGGVARLVFMLAVPTDAPSNQYMSVLSSLARLLMHEEFRRSLLDAEDPEAVVKAVENGEELLERSRKEG